MVCINVERVPQARYDGDSLCGFIIVVLLLDHSTCLKLTTLCSTCGLQLTIVIAQVVIAHTTKKRATRLLFKGVKTALGMAKWWGCAIWG